MYFINQPDDVYCFVYRQSTPTRMTPCRKTRHYDYYRIEKINKLISPDNSTPLLSIIRKEFSKYFCKSACRL